MSERPVRIPDPEWKRWDQEVARCKGLECGIPLRGEENRLCVYCRLREAEESNGTTSNGDLPVKGEAKEYTCRHCGDRFTKSQQLAVHVRTAHPKSSSSPPAPRGSKRRPAAANGTPTCCSLCGGDLSPFARSVYAGLIAEGLDPTTALRGAAVAQRSLRTGGS